MSDIIINPNEPKITIKYKVGVRGGEIETQLENIPNPLVFLDMIKGALQVYGEVEGQKLQKRIMEQLEAQGHPALSQ